MRLTLAAFLLCLPLLRGWSQTYCFDGRDKEAIQVLPADTYTSERGYGWDMAQVVMNARAVETATYRLSPCVRYFSVALPDGNYRIRLTLGNHKKAACVTVRAEARRLIAENIPIQKGKFVELNLIVNKRDDIIRFADGKTDRVRTKTTKGTKLVWDEKLTLEINSDVEVLCSMTVTPAPEVPTLWLCGNSTVVDQESEPWASWGQMIPRWLTDGIAVANYAESGESATSFIAEKRLQKILTLMKPGDYICMEFGHNDQKEQYSGSGPYYSFAYALKQFVDAARSKGGIPIFITPTQRRIFDADGTIVETHGQYPEAMRWVARDLQVPLIELHEMTRTFFETLGVEGSKSALVHYPKGTFPGQEQPLTDNTHFNAYGAYEVAKMVVAGIRELPLGLKDFIRGDCPQFSPSAPDDVTTFRWPYSPYMEMTKPAGN